MIKIRTLAVFALLLATLHLSAQDSLYTRRVLKFLCSEKCFGRGYLNKGLQQAEHFIVGEIKKSDAKPLFGKSYTQAFRHSVNTFPSKMELSINGKTLKAGYDFIPNADDATLKGSSSLVQMDSVTYLGSIFGREVLVKIKNKLTYTVGHAEENKFIIELDRHKFSEVPKEITLDVKNKLIPQFESRNIACSFNGSSNSDSVMVFTAHYDHLGGLGKSCYFPGANDNASGVSMVLNLLKYYQQHPPKYKTIFVFFAGEEAGLVGSKYFVESNALDLKKIKFLINLDLMGTGDEGIMVVNGAVFNNQFDHLQTINSEKNLLPQIKKRGKAANSDHYWFSEKGVPCFFIYTMGGVTFYHDVYDRAETLPLTKYKEVFVLLTEYLATF